MSEVKFMYCEVCGNLDAVVYNGKGERICCGQPMVELEADTVDAAKEKHVPVVTRDGNTVTVEVGSVPHPMEEDHWIQMIAIVKDSKFLVARLEPGDEPKVTVEVGEEGPLKVYEFCNLHGLWMTEA